MADRGFWVYLSTWTPAATQVDLAEEETQKYVGSNLVLRSRRLSRRISVSRPAAHTRKVRLQVSVAQPIRHSDPSDPFRNSISFFQVADKKGNKKYAFWRGRSRRKPAERARGTARLRAEQLQGQVRPRTRPGGS